MKLTDNQVWAIVSAQWRSWLHMGPKSAWGMWILYILWYGFAAFLAWVAATVLPGMKDPARLLQVVELSLFLGLLYWQLMPVLIASSGMSLDLKRLLVYPIEPSKLFTIEVILRLSSGIEVVIVLIGVSIGLWRHPAAPWWGPLIFAPYLAFNMFLSAGIRDLIARLMAKRGVREVVLFGIVLVTAAPQMLLMMFPPERWERQKIVAFIDAIPTLPFPWTMSARTALGEGALWAAPIVLLWLAAGLWFGYRQFIAGLTAEKPTETRKEPQQDRRPSRLAGLAEAFYRLPSRVLPDPLGGLVEKEVRFLSRAPRFRLVFFMGFSFGLVIWFPIAFRHGREGGMMAQNFLVWVSLYATLMLGDLIFWNFFGFDRRAVQTYFVIPVRFSTVLIAKNITAIYFLVLEILIVAAVCSFFKVELKLFEALAVTLMTSIYLLAAGNLMSLRGPRPADPANSWRNSSAGKVQLYLLVVYPLLSIPVALAYLARYAFGTQSAFYLALLGGYAVGIITYYVALESAVDYANREQETIIAALSKSEGPFGG